MNHVTSSTTTDQTVVIRQAGGDDLEALRRLAALDSARALLGSVLVAEVDGKIQAALSVEEQREIADPFVPTAGLVELLHARAALLRGAHARRARGSGRTGRALLARL